MTSKERYPHIKTADTSYTVVLIPDIHFCDELVAANQQLSSRFPENSYELSERFPPHLTLFQGGTTEEGVERLIEKLAPVLKYCNNLTFTANTLTAEPNGFISISCEGQDLVDLAEEVTRICSEEHATTQVYRPREIERFGTLTADQQTNLIRTGSSKAGSYFAPHISLASVDPSHAEEALALARVQLSLPRALRSSAITIINAGHRNELREVLWSTADS